MNYGYVLKLSQQNVIVTVYDGLHEMDKNQIQQIYPNRFVPVS